ncbi:hydrogenase nickel incorporation protein HypB [Chrysiogenes arsenatis]|uniref:hydrogenase nickel incorporation protein HypB n=1 Tax=Chrysiogenes arsenatis TaxID=309797 RepID=UPI000425C0A1|nr:hydrogenase nickel incorporation protein HypB [Chrysiogenes arsenatis]
MCTDCGCAAPGGNFRHSHSHQHGDTHHAHEHHHDHTHDHGHDPHHHHHDDTAAANPHLQKRQTVEVVSRLLEKNVQQAVANRAHFAEHNILAINLMSSPGSGKTSLLEKLSAIANFRFGVIEGDLETNRDAARLQAKGVPAVQITTGTACHLDADMVHRALHDLPLNELEVVFIENVGNLVCPAAFDLGAHLNIVLLSVPEGDDKVAKYPVMFRIADLVILTKNDLLPYIPFREERVKEDLRQLNPKADYLSLNLQDDAALKKVCDYLLLKKQLRG